MLRRPGQLLRLQRETLTGNLADRALLRGRIPLVDVAANRTYPFFHNFYLLYNNLKLK
jgi:hypothetical protein